MTIEPQTSLAIRILELMSQEHQKGTYVYTLDEAAARDEGLRAEVGAADDCEIKATLRCLGEAQIEMLYEASDAAMVGVGLTSDMKHAIFLEHLDYKVTLARHVRPGSYKFRYAPKA